MDDWSAVRQRLADQVQGLVDLSAVFVGRVDRVVSQDRAEAIRNAEHARRRLFIVVPVTALLTMLLVVAIGWRVTRTITEPLAELSAGAQALGRGEFQHEVEVTGETNLQHWESLLTMPLNSFAGSMRACARARSNGERHLRATRRCTLW